MKAIRTRFYPATNVSPSRIIATSDSGKMFKYSYHSLPDGNEEFKHVAAARAYARSMGWTQHGFVSGSFKNDYYHVFVYDVHTYKS